VAFCSIQPFGHKRHGPKIGGRAPWGAEFAVYTIALCHCFSRLTPVNAWLFNGDDTGWCSGLTDAVAGLALSAVAMDKFTQQKNAQAHGAFDVCQLPQKLLIQACPSTLDNTDTYGR